MIANDIAPIICCVTSNREIGQTCFFLQPSLSRWPGNVWRLCPVGEARLWPTLSTSPSGRASMLKRVVMLGRYVGGMTCLLAWTVSNDRRLWLSYVYSRQIADPTFRVFSLLSRVFSTMVLLFLYSTSSGDHGVHQRRPGECSLVRQQRWTGQYGSWYG